MAITYQWEIMNLHLTQESGSLNNIVNAKSCSSVAHDTNFDNYLN